MPHLHSTEVVTPALAAFLDEVMPVDVGTLRRDGTVQLNPAWYEYRDGLIWLNTARSRAWGRHLEVGSAITLLFVDPADMFHWAQIQGRVVEKTEADAAAHIDALARRYTGADYRQHDADDPRIILKVEPERVRGFRG